MSSRRNLYQSADAIYKMFLLHVLDDLEKEGGIKGGRAYDHISVISFLSSRSYYLQNVPPNSLLIQEYGMEF